MMTRLQELSVLGLLAVGCGAFALKAGLNIRDARRRQAQGTVGWKSKSVTTAWIVFNTVVIVVVIIGFLYLLLRGLFG